MECRVPNADTISVEQAVNLLHFNDGLRREREKTFVSIASASGAQARLMPRRPQRRRLCISHAVSTPVFCESGPVTESWFPSRSPSSRSTVSCAWPVTRAVSPGVTVAGVLRVASRKRRYRTRCFSSRYINTDAGSMRKIATSTVARILSLSDIQSHRLPGIKHNPHRGVTWSARTPSPIARYTGWSSRLIQSNTKRIKEVAVLHTTSVSCT